ncbi:MAG: DUF2142 domain-containing protein [Chloroflexi bacterium]|nr:DUF2142 domain-containing protein [Chloroflexota bacterium]
MTVPAGIGEQDPGQRENRVTRSAPSVAARPNSLLFSSAWPIAIVLLLHLVLGVIYSLVIPAWEAHDETGHFPYVRYLATHGSLPAAGEKISNWFDEVHQPPLYYALGAAATFWIDTSDYREPELNPFGFSGTGIGGFNVVTHDSDESFPYHGTLLALHLARLVSVLLSTIVVWITYKLAAELFPDSPLVALGGAMLNAFLPMFLYMGSVVNNDIAVALCSSWVILLLARILRRGSDLKVAMLTGLALGLALLSKNGAIALVPLVMIVYVYSFIMSGKRYAAEIAESEKAGVSSTLNFTYLFHLMIAGLASLIITGWWYLRNLMLYGTPLPDRAADNPITSTLAPLAKSAHSIVDLGWWRLLLDNSFRTFWGVFGWGNVAMSDSIYSFLAIVTLAMLAGIVFWLLRSQVRGIPRSTRTAVLFLLLVVACVGALPLYRAIFFQDPFLLPGRYLLPGISAICVLLAGGFEQLGLWLAAQATRSVPAAPESFVEYRGMSGEVLLMSLGLLVLATYIPFGVIRPVYALPPRLTEATLHPTQPADFKFGDSLELRGYDIEESEIRPGEVLHVTLYWRALQPMAENYTVGVSILDGKLNPWGATNTYPGNGNYPTARWHAGEIIRDAYQVELGPDAAVPSLGHLRVQVHKYTAPSTQGSASTAGGKPDAAYLPVTDKEGKAATAIFGRFKLAVPYVLMNPGPGGKAGKYRLGNVVALQDVQVSAGGAAGPLPANASQNTVWQIPAAQAGQSLQVQMVWHALTPDAKDYTVFVHLWNAQGEQVGQVDQQPTNGAYPTGLWGAGDVVTDTLNLPLIHPLNPGRYRLTSGMYLLETLQRLPAVDTQNQRFKDDVIELGTIEVIQ